MDLNAELRPRRELLNPNFEGYKLSLDQLPVRDVRLDEPVAIFTTKSEEISFVNFSLYAQHQTLFTDRWMNSIFWFSKSEGMNLLD